MAKIRDKNKSNRLSKSNNKNNETLSQKRARAGRKGGLAPHECRGRGCNNDE